MSSAHKTAGPEGRERRPRPLLRFAGRWIRRYFFAVGLAVHVVALGAVVYTIRQYQVTLPQLIVKAIDRYDIRAPLLVRLLSPSPAFPDYVTDGRVRPTHPRIVAIDSERLGGRPLLDHYREAGLQAPKPPCGTRDYLLAAICWTVTADNGQAVQAIASLRNISIFDAADVHEGSSADSYSNAWRVALAYDLLFNHPSFGASAKGFVEHELEKALRRQLLALDGDYLSLWHSRSTTAHIAFLTAIVLSQNSPERADLFRRAQAHFIESMKALALTEGWPEGYNYWINSRGFLAALAANAYALGLDDARNEALVKKALSRAAYWTIYETRPDNRIEGLGDEGPRVDLKDETRRVVDLIARLTRDPVLSAYSRYLATLNRESYYRGHAWSFFIANDPTVRPVAEPDKKSLRFLDGILPTADIFGPGALDRVLLRSGWGPNDTFISFRAGRTFTHHGHYDAGHFSLFKGGPLAINSSVYGGNVFAPNRLNYSIRTVAKNSLLILRPGEEVRPNRFFDRNVAAGGQRITMPTGSAIVSLADWYERLSKGRTAAGGRITSFVNLPPLFAYAGSDLTDAYNTPAVDAGGSGGKVRRVNRKLLYLYGQDLLIVSDSIDAVEAGYTKKWLLHTTDRPELDNVRILKGGTSSGIMTSRSDHVVVRSRGSSLLVTRLLPKDAAIRLVGGPDYQYYVETDGDDSDLDGTNFVAGATNRRWFDVGRWRIEVQPGAARKHDRFLMVLAPSVGPVRRGEARLLSVSDDGVDGLTTDRLSVLFVDRPTSKRFTFRSIARQSGIVVAGLARGQRVRVETSSSRTAETTAANEVALLDVALSPGDEVSVSIENGRPAD